MKEHQKPCEILEFEKQQKTVPIRVSKRLYEEVIAKDSHVCAFSTWAKDFFESCGYCKNFTYCKIHHFDLRLRPCVNKEALSGVIRE